MIKVMSAEKKLKLAIINSNLFVSAASAGLASVC